MTRLLTSCAAAATLLLLTAGLYGASPAVAAATPPAVAEAEKALDAFQTALAAGDRDAALALLAPEVSIFEAGDAELSRDEYAAHHLGADLEFLAATKTERIDRRSGTSGDLVWILTRSRTTGTFHGKPIATLGAETALLARTPAGWRIVHLHWSSRAARK